MARHPYIFAEAIQNTENIQITGSEARHLAASLRARPGYEFIAFDGKGHGCLAQIVATGRKEVVAKVVYRLHDESLPVVCITVAVSIIKGNRMDWAVEKAAEIGAWKFIPMLSEFGVVDPRQSRLDHWHGITMSAAKQSRRKRVMIVDAPQNLQDVITTAENTIWAFDNSEGCILFTELIAKLKPSSKVTMLIGPEGGFSDKELATFREHNIHRVSIGPHPLRTETAVAVGIGIIVNKFFAAYEPSSTDN